MTKVEVAGSLRLGGGPLHAITWTEMIYFLRCLARKIQKPMHGQMAPARCAEVGLVRIQWLEKHQWTMELRACEHLCCLPGSLEKSLNEFIILHHLCCVDSLTCVPW
jgi:hypothetical protein